MRVSSSHGSSLNRRRLIRRGRSRTATCTLGQIIKPSRIVRVEGVPHAYMPQNPHRRRVEQMDTSKRLTPGCAAPKEPPITILYALEVFMLDPTATLAGVTGTGPSPDLPKDCIVDPSKDALGDNVAMIGRPSAYYRIEPHNKQGCRHSKVFTNDFLCLSQKTRNALARRLDKKLTVRISPNVLSEKVKALPQVRHVRLFRRKDQATLG